MIMTTSGSCPSATESALTVIPSSCPQAPPATGSHDASGVRQPGDVSPYQPSPSAPALSARIRRALTSIPLGRFRARMTVMESYVERPPLPGLAGVVRTVWIQRTGEAAYVQRHLPTGGVEIHFPIGGHPQLVGPLTGPEIEVIPAHTTIVGVRFQPGTAPPLPTVLDDLVDQRLGLAELWGSSGDRLVEAMARAGTPEQALMFLQAHLVQEFRSAVRVDPLVGEAVQAPLPARSWLESQGSPADVAIPGISRAGSGRRHG